MMGYDKTLADRLDAIAPTVAHRLDDIVDARDTVSAAADRLRKVADMPDASRPLPPIEPLPLAAMPSHFEHTLEKVDGLQDGFHDVGRMPERNAKLPKSDTSQPAKQRAIFTDPRLREKPKSK